MAADTSDKDMMDEDMVIVDYPTLNILIFGRSGTAKSVIANGICGCPIVKERDGIVTEMRKDTLQHYTWIAHEMKLNVWISSSLQDGCDNEKGCLDQLKKECSNTNLIIYCLKMTETRFLPRNADAVSMVKITETLGKDCWKKTVFALTYANVAAAAQYGEHELKSSASRTTFQESIRMWKAVIINTLSNEVGLQEEYLDIKVAPAGHYKVPDLPDRDYWLSSFWSLCVETISPKEVQEAMFKINASRLKKRINILPQDFIGKNIYEQPIVIQENTSYIYTLSLYLIKPVLYVYDALSGVLKY